MSTHFSAYHTAKPNVTVEVMKILSVVIVAYGHVNREVKATEDQEILMKRW